MHQHHSNCNCGHDHTHHESCGCAHCEGSGHEHVPVTVPNGLSVLQTEFLCAIFQRGCLPVASFALTKANEEERYMTALAPVYLSSPEDSMPQVKAWGTELTGLTEMDLITLDYDRPIEGYPYTEYKDSHLYAYFIQTAAEAAAQPGAAFDTPLLEMGSMALTDAGVELAEMLLSD